MARLSEKSVEALAPGEREYVIWDDEVSGFGVRVRPTGAKAFLLVYRRGGKLRKHTMGKPQAGYHVREARERAIDLLRGLRDGIDPQQAKAKARRELTLSDLIDLYLAEGPALKPDKKADTWKGDKGLFECHVKPLLGRWLARDVTRVDIAKMQKDIADGKTARNVKTGHRRRSRVTGGKTVAANTVAILGACYQFGIETERVKVNPTKGVKRFRTNRRERYLSERELACFNAAIREFEQADPRLEVMADAIRLLIFTGCRKNEILKLAWLAVDWNRKCLRLAETKTGPRVVPLADAAIELLQRRWRAGRDEPDLRGHNSGECIQPKARSPFVLPAMKGEGYYVGLPHHWERVRIRANEIARERAREAGDHPDDVATLLDVRIHDLRHSFASFAIADGASLFMVGKVLGHRQARTTEIYAHLSNDPIRQVASRTAARLERAMSG